MGVMLKICWTTTKSLTLQGSPWDILGMPSFLSLCTFSALLMGGAAVVRGAVSLAVLE